jgi:uncharacterized RDD family membrane protein YckC
MDDEFLDEFDFKPITNGLGFHHPKPQDVKPVFNNKIVPPAVQTTAPVKSDMSVYQNDLSIFYGATSTQAPSEITQIKINTEPKIEKEYLLASRSQRVIAYLLDFFAIVGVLGIVLTVMARTISMDLLELWSAYPHEITPLVLVLFTGFYLIYFSIFEKDPSSTVGKYIIGLKVVGLDNKAQNISTLFLRSFITLANFLSLGLFSWFDLQNKITKSKVIRTN